jgi:hypothetical protein
MIAKCRWLLPLLVIVAIFPPLQTVAADVGPKPTMDFQFMQDFPGPAVTILGGSLDQCNRSDCQDAQPLAALGPQQFSCTATTCHALAYGFSPYNQLFIQFSDGKTRRSNVFKTDGFQSAYKVTIRTDDLLVEPQISLNLFSPWTYLLLCICCLVVLVVFVGVILLIVRSRRRRK